MRRQPGVADMYGGLAERYKAVAETRAAKGTR
jgi:hypothetical protein